MSSSPPLPGQNNGFYGPEGLTYKFNASMAIIVVVLVTTFFFMALFVLYIRRCNMITSAGWTDQANNNNNNRQQQQQQQQQQGTHHGLDAETLQKLPILRYSSIKMVKRSKAGPECAVCLLPFEESDVVRLLPDCGHLFHSECIDMWLETHSTCPLCRRSLDPKSLPAPNLQRALSAVMSSFRRDPIVDPADVEAGPPPASAAVDQAEHDAANASRRHQGAEVVRTLSMHSESFKIAVHDMDLLQVREKLRARSLRVPKFHHSKSFGNLPDHQEHNDDECRNSSGSNSEQHQQQHEVRIESDVELRRSVSDGQSLKPHELGEPSRAMMFQGFARRSFKWLVGSGNGSAAAAEDEKNIKTEKDRS